MMLQFAAIIYAMVMTFVLSAATRNRREGRSHARIIVYAGYLLCGLSAGVAVALPIAAGMGVNIEQAVA